MFPHTSSLGQCLKIIPITVLVHLFPCLCESVFFFLFLQAHSFYPLVASLAPWTSLVGSKEKTEGDGTRCRCPTAADWRMCRGARLMLYKRPQSRSALQQIDLRNTIEGIKTFVK